MNKQSSKYTNYYIMRFCNPQAWEWLQPDDEELCLVLRRTKLRKNKSFLYMKSMTSTLFWYLTVYYSVKSTNFKSFFEWNTMVNFIFLFYVWNCVNYWDLRKKFVLFNLQLIIYLKSYVPVVDSWFLRTYKNNEPF